MMSAKTGAVVSEPPPRDDDLPDDLICVRDACLLVPSPRSGRKTSLSTCYRWINTGKIRAWRRGRWSFVSRAEILKLLVPRLVEPIDKSQMPPTPRRQAAMERWRKREEEWARGVLDAAGI